MAQLLLQKAYRQTQKEPLEGFFFEPCQSNIFEWSVYLEGPKHTPYSGGIFELKMTFPDDYPMNPPKLYFVSEFWHPNVYSDGKVCISILHPPVDDPLSGELPEERWMPCQTVETIMLSVLSMLGDPNLSSPANVDASVECRDSFANYCNRIKALVNKSNAHIPPHVQIAHPEPVKKKIDENLHDDSIGYDDINYDMDVYGLYGGDQYPSDNDDVALSDEKEQETKSTNTATPTKKENKNNKSTHKKDGDKKHKKTNKSKESSPKLKTTDKSPRKHNEKKKEHTKKPSTSTPNEEGKNTITTSQKGEEKKNTIPTTQDKEKDKEKDKDKVKDKDKEKEKDKVKDKEKDKVKDKDKDKEKEKDKEKVKDKVKDKEKKKKSDHHCKSTDSLPESNSTLSTSGSGTKKKDRKSTEEKLKAVGDKEKDKSKPNNH